MVVKRPITSVTILLDKLEFFAKSSSLVAKSSKSDMYLASIPTFLKQHIVDSCSIPLGSIPFRYLGVPLSSKRITAVECERLVV